MFRPQGATYYVGVAERNLAQAEQAGRAPGEILVEVMEKLRPLVSAWTADRGAATAP